MVYCISWYSSKVTEKKILEESRWDFIVVSALDVVDTIGRLLL